MILPRSGGTRIQTWVSKVTSSFPTCSITPQRRGKRTWPWRPGRIWWVEKRNQLSKVRWAVISLSSTVLTLYLLYFSFLVTRLLLLSSVLHPFHVCLKVRLRPDGTECQEGARLPDGVCTGPPYLAWLCGLKLRLGCVGSMVLGAWPDR